MAGLPLRTFAKKTKKEKSDKQQKEKEQIREELAEAEVGDIDEIKDQFEEKLQECIEMLREEYASIKGSRASADLFDDLEVKAYGEMQSFQDIAQTIVRGD